ncbi:NPCBM/NEW2 domain-containing protein [Flammeovirga agarivorans]|uniref:Glycosyl hydrolase family 98 putative carbohydrate-binding module domain-containing protein n=1 Tax=Flammeovirga agarivorans TaxID=2726742 RepID=A0A7X8SN73_9BACT|nr:NPCBM/NEW2 domain-containing protein [Flammeovirga agarivorans]NLR93300.1 hypothetical protein [Flammeovirga agarivorans]
MKIQKKLIVAASVFVATSLNVFAQEAATGETAAAVEVMKGKKVYLKSTATVGATSSYWKINQDKAVSNEKLTMKGVEYKKGLGVHAPSKLIYEVPPKAEFFYVVPGADDAHQGLLKMNILVDGKEVFTTGNIKSKSDKYMPKMVAIDVKGASSLELVVDQLEENGGDHADWAEAFFVEGKKENAPKDAKYAKAFKQSLEDDELPGAKVYLTKEKASLVDSFWKVMNDEGIEGGKISISGKKYNHGLGVHAPSKLVFPIESNYKTFAVIPGANDSNGGLIRMRILVDNKEVFNSGPIRSQKQKPELLQIDVQGKKEITLIVDEEDGDKGGDHASWAGAYFMIDGDTK